MNHEHAQETARTISGDIRRRVRERGTLIATHRGSAGGRIVENTVESGLAAVAGGTDLLEFDIVRSTDGKFFVFHDGYEHHHFCITESILDLSSKQIESLEYRLIADHLEPRKVTQVSELLMTMPEDLLFNVDRSWWYWDTLLDYLDQFEMSERLIFKCPPEAKWLDYLASHSVKYPVIPMVRTVDEVEFVASYPGVALVGFELIASQPEHPFVSSTYIQSLHERGYVVLVNALNLESGAPLFAGYDDEKALFGEPNRGWGHLVDLGVDVIQTDWPALLAAFLGKPVGLQFSKQ